MPRFDILTVGDLCVDLVVSGLDVTPGFAQQEKLVESYDLMMGGSCSIFACQAAKLGLRVGVIGVVGADPFGELILQTLKDSGVDTSLIRVDGTVKTGLSVHLQQGQERAILTYLGSMVTVPPQEVTAQIDKTRHLHIGSFFLLSQLQAHFADIAAQAKACGATVSLDTNWDPSEKWDGGLAKLLPLVDVFLPNEAELLAISRCSSVPEALDHLKDMVPMTAVKLGQQGAIGQHQSERLKLSVPSVPVADTVGAGDNFDAGFLYGFLQQRPLNECLAVACACAVASVQKPGGIQGQLNADSLKKQLLSYNEL